MADETRDAVSGLYHTLGRYSHSEDLLKNLTLMVKILGVIMILIIFEKTSSARRSRTAGLSPNVSEEGQGNKMNILS